MTGRGAAVVLRGVKKSFTDQVIFANRVEKKEQVRSDMRERAF